MDYEKTSRASGALSAGSMRWICRASLAAVILFAGCHSIRALTPQPMPGRVVVWVRPSGVDERIGTIRGPGEGVVSSVRIEGVTLAGDKTLFSGKKRRGRVCCTVTKETSKAPP